MSETIEALRKRMDELRAVKEAAFSVFDDAEREYNSAFEEWRDAASAAATFQPGDIIETPVYPELRVERVMVQTDCLNMYQCLSPTRWGGYGSPRVMVHDKVPGYIRLVRRAGEAP